MIKILDNNFKRLAILNKAINPNRFEEINGENVLNFEAILDEKVATYLNENSIIELNNDYFDIAYLRKNHNEDGTLTVEVETEHVSYRLNNPEYDKEWFTEIGTPSYILEKILAGTGFTIKTIEFTTTLTYSAQEKKSRRQLLMEFAHLLGGELIFNKFEISIVNRRGNVEPQLFTTGKNIKIVSKIYNKREIDEEGNPLVAYVCEPILLPNVSLSLGDNALLVQKDLGIREDLRVVSYSYNPYDKMEATIELANFISGLEDAIYRIQTTTVTKEKVYNGCRIGPDEGFVAERSDLKAKTIMNATEGISIYSDLGSGLERNFFVDLNGRIQARGLDIAGDATFEGTIEASDIIGGTINIGNGNFTVDSNGNMIAYSGQFEGDITGATGNFQGTVKANQILIGGSNGRLSFEDLNDQPFIPDDGYITTITEDTLMTTNVFARYLEVRSANIIGTITADSLSTNAEINVGTDAYIGDYLFLGDGGSSGFYKKGIELVYGGSNTCSIEVDRYGDMSIFSWGNIDIKGSGLNLDAGVENVLIEGKNVELWCATNGSVVLTGRTILDDETFVGYQSQNNYVSTYSETGNSLSYNATTKQLRLLDVNGNVLSSVTL